MGKGYVNLANLGISTETRAKILALGTKIRSIGQVAQGKVNGLSDPNTLWTIGWLFSIMGMVAAKHRQKKAQIKAKETTKANATHPSTATDKSNKQAHAENNANQCKTVWAELVVQLPLQWVPSSLPMSMHNLVE